MWLRVFQNISQSIKNSVLTIATSKMPFYAVANGRSVGIYQTWDECEAQVKGFSGAKYKKFNSESSAQDFLKDNRSTSSAPKPKSSHKYASNNTSYNQKKSFSTSSSSHQKGNSSKIISPKSKAWQESIESDDESQSDDLDEVLYKQMDDIEKRLNTFKKGVDNIEKKATKSTSRAAIMIEAPEPKRARKTKNAFEEDNDGYVQVYTDGACSANGRYGAKAGIGVYWGDDHQLNISEPVSGRATNNCGEIQAATRAMKQAIDNGLQKLTINTDSQFLINAVTKWMTGWKRKGWKLASGEPVKNEVDFKILDSLQHKVKVKWNYVEAHRGIYGNEKADELAKAGAAMYRQTNVK